MAKSIIFALRKNKQFLSMKKIFVRGNRNSYWQGIRGNEQIVSYQLLIINCFCIFAVIVSFRN